MAERGVRFRRRQPPGPGLLGHEADRGVLHPGAGHAPDQDDQPARGRGPALLLRHGRRQRARVLLVPRRPRCGPGRLRASDRARPGRVDQRGRLDEPRRVQRARGALPRVPGQAEGQGRPGQPGHRPRRQRVRRGQGTASRGVRPLVLLPGPGRHPARVRLMATGHGPARRRSARAEDRGRPDRRDGLGRGRARGVMTAPAPTRPASAARPEKATRKGRQTDEAFREAARLVFARDGYLNAKISDIAAAAGRSVASFYNYYDTKADLLIALAEEFHAEATQLAARPDRAGLSGAEAPREPVAGFGRTYAKRRGELIGIFQAAMIEGRFRDRWLELRGEAITRIATAVRKAQAEGYCPGVDPVMTASALSAMLEHFCYI